MSQEIELKFLVHPDVTGALRAALNALPGDHTTPRKLLNIYYETPDMLLRRHDMGLRIRGVDGCYEMTMKTAGRTVGGLHQRPEYNVALTEPRLALSRFPQEMWPEGLDAQTLEPQLSPLFHTDFEREKWVVAYGKSRIEIALDMGEIRGGESREPLSELELELLDGRVEDILALAREHLLRDGLRQGGLSKAARGYNLARGNAPGECKALSVLELPPKATLEQGLSGALAQALAHWQYHEELLARGVPGAQKQVAHAVALARHILALFGVVVPRKASARLREQLSQFSDALDAETDTDALAWRVVCGSAKLTLIDWLVTCGWQPFLSEAARSKMQGSFKRFADTHLSRVAAELKAAFRQPLAGRDIDQLPRLERALHCAYVLAGFYPHDARQPWIEGWQALARAIDGNLVYQIEPLRKQALSVAPFWRHSGQ
ncbi:inorganic triphosphatase [Enterobacteriaceae bacterium YMB-R22]|uniref:CYTH domain-containing protein n=1 Tax=Tenebrionicola larvae TaxID=2815733 RepID=UPI0020135122|nr:inorganic triphosphatase [Tenebrionicola larvae]MBV4412872.1 inorganic triphosphatase [Tenebrionicola larvae]